MRHLIDSRALIWYVDQDHLVKLDVDAANTPKTQRRMDRATSAGPVTCLHHSRLQMRKTAGPEQSGPAAF